MCFIVLCNTEYSIINCVAVKQFCLMHRTGAKAEGARMSDRIHALASAAASFAKGAPATYYRYLAIEPIFIPDPVA